MVYCQAQGSKDPRLKPLMALTLFGACLPGLFQDTPCDLPSAGFLPTLPAFLKAKRMITLKYKSNHVLRLLKTFLWVFIACLTPFSK